MQAWELEVLGANPICWSLPVGGRIHFFLLGVCVCNNILHYEVYVFKSKCYKISSSLQIKSAIKILMPLCHVQLLAHFYTHMEQGLIGCGTMSLETTVGRPEGCFLDIWFPVEFKDIFGPTGFGKRPY